MSVRSLQSLAWEAATSGGVNLLTILPQEMYEHLFRSVLRPFDEVPQVSETFYPNGRLEKRVWLNNLGQLDRIGGPAEIAYHDNGVLNFECWYRDGKENRVGDHAYTAWDREGGLCRTMSFDRGRPHVRRDLKWYRRVWSRGQIINYEAFSHKD